MIISLLDSFYCHSLKVTALSSTSVLQISSRCGGAVNIIACIEDPLVTKKILAYMDAKFGAVAIVNQPKRRTNHTPI